MKKLMLTAAAAAMAAGAFADMPAVYDYKATVKHMYLKEVNATVQNFLGQKQTVKVYQKYQKSASLKGYLIHDVLGATSAAAFAGYVNPAVAAPIVARNPQGPWHNAGVGLTGVNPPVIDKVNNRAFLVVQNASAEANVRAPKILPAVLEAKFFDTKYSMTWNLGGAQPVYTSGIAEGTLFVGGDTLIGGVKEYLRNDRNDATLRNPSIAAYIPGTDTPDTAAGTIFAATAYLDYGWTSIYLFGKYNGAQGSANWAAAQAAISGVQVIPDVGGARYYHDTWMNGVGVGKYGVIDDAEQCCGFQVGGVNFGLDTLAGKLKGGLFLCSENGYRADTYVKLGGIDWEDQFWNEKAFSTWGNPAVGLPPNYVNVAGTLDVDQEDVWIDGDVELFTTDVLDGDWSIKRLASAKVPSVALTAAEISALSGLALPNATQSYRSTFSRSVVGTVDNTDLDDLNAVIKGCAFALKSNVEFVRGANTIPGIATQGSNARYNVPFLDRNFARAYGLMAYALGNF